MLKGQPFEYFYSINNLLNEMIRKEGIILNRMALP